MKTSFKDSSASPPKSDLLVLFGVTGAKPSLPEGVDVPAGVRADFDGEFKKTRFTYTGSESAPRVLFVGLGGSGDVDAERLRRAAAIGVKRAACDDLGKVVMWLAPKIEQIVGGEVAGRALTEGAVLGAYAFDALKSERKPRSPRTVTLCGDGADFRRGGQRGRLLADANAFARDLQNMPANRMRPVEMAAEARKLARQSDRVTCRVLDEKAMVGLGMGSLLSVARGSEEPALLLHLTYKPKGKPKGRVALVGKGLTFDSGGISIKPAAGMDEMKYDMSGGAAVLGVFHALAHGLDVPQEVHGVVGCTENLINGRATKPGDVVTAMNGKTIEILNTDAEGRLVLADALCYADKKIQPDTIVDLATLTGAVIIALGHELTGIFPNTDSLRDQLVAAGLACGERCWPLPLLDVHKEQMKSTIADLRNINSKSHGNGSTAGAAFLSHFVGGREWAHLDIAGTAWNALDRDWTGGSLGTGVGVRLLLEYLAHRD